MTSRNPLLFKWSTGYGSNSQDFSCSKPVASMLVWQVVCELITTVSLILQLTVEPHPFPSMASHRLTRTQQKVQWWCSSVTQGLIVPEGEIWQQCVGFPAQERSPVAPDPHRCSQRHPYWPQVLHAVDRVYWQLIRHPGFEFQQISGFCFRSSLFSNAQDFSCSYHWDPGVD